MTDCCIVGGGPAGVMLGFLLARAGAKVTVLEKHKDFNRDFRGDTVHPSTLRVMQELGLLEDFLALPHQQLSTLDGNLGDFTFRAADFRHVPSPCQFVALMPQWDFLNFLTARGKRYPGFDLRMEHRATGLERRGDRVVGVQVETPSGTEVIETPLVVGCDGRHAVTRAVAGLPVEEVGVPIDVLWFGLSRQPDDPELALGHVNYGSALITINRGTYFQCGLIIRKGSFADWQQRGLESFKEHLRRLAPFFGERTDELQRWDQVKLLSVQINRLLRWYAPGLLCIGDCAHAMSPAGGVGINLALQDAVAAANILGAAIRERRVHQGLLAKVQQRREWPTRMTQGVQVRAHKAFEWVFDHTGPIEAPWQMKTVAQFPGIERLLARVVGMGFRPEHVALRAEAFRPSTAAASS